MFHFRQHISVGLFQSNVKENKVKLLPCLTLNNTFGLLLMEGFF